MENEKKKKGIGKRIAAIFASALLIFAKGSANTNVTPLPDPEMPKIESQMLEDNKSNYYNIAKHYPDFKETGTEIISLNDLQEVYTGEGTCDTMVPQGLAMLDGYLLVSAYDGIEGYRGDLGLHSYKKSYRDKLKEEKDHEVHNSVIVVLDKETKKPITTIELPDQNHVGGIAIDDENLYVAKSQDGVISLVSLNKIRRAIELGAQKGVKVAKMDYDKELKCDCDASFISLREHEGEEQLVIGTWSPFPNSSVIRIFDLKEDSLTLNQKFTTNSSANGAAFIQKEGKEYFVVACSMGRSLDSNLFVYEVEEDNDGKIKLNGKSNMILPPMVEEFIEVEKEDGKRQLLLSSEACSRRYEIGRRKVISDGIMVFDLDKVLDRETKEKRKIPLVFQDIFKEEEVKEVENDREER